MGSCTVKVTIHWNTASLPLVVVKGNWISCLGRNWLEEIKLDWTKVQALHKLLIKRSLITSLNSTRRYLGVSRLVQIQYESKTSRQARCCSKSLSSKTNLWESGGGLERLGVISKVETSEWATLTVPVRKPNGWVCLCGNYKIMINLNVNQYPLLRPEEHFAALNNGQHFTMQAGSFRSLSSIELDNDSKKCVTRSGKTCIVHTSTFQLWWLI